LHKICSRRILKAHKAVDFVCDRHVVLQGLWQLTDRGVNLLNGFTDSEQKTLVLDTIVEMGR